MRRSTTALVILAVGVIAIALVLRNGETPPEAAGPTTATSEPTTELDGATTSQTPAPSTSSTEPSSTISAPTIGSSIPQGANACDLYPSIEAAGTVTSNELVEGSGLAASRTTPNVLWSHNDSRGEPALYAMDETGTDLGGFVIPDAFSIDWEDMAAGPGFDGTGAYLYVGDMGDNFAIRDGIIYVWQVPDVAPDTMDGSFPTSSSIVLQMPGGAQDAEALFIDPIEPAAYVVTKSRSGTTVFKGPLVSTDAPEPMEAVAHLFLDAEVSGADITADGSIIALRGYTTVWLWTRAPDQSISDALAADPCIAPSADERQGEAIAFDPAGNYFTLSEGTHPTLYEAALSMGDSAN